MFDTHTQISKYRVLHFLKAMDPAGIEKGIMSLYRQMDRTEIQFDFAVHSLHEGYYEKEIRQLGGAVFRVPSPKGDLWRFKKEWDRTLRDWSHTSNKSQLGIPIAVHSHSAYFSGIVLRQAAKAGVSVRIAASHRVNASAGGIRGLYMKAMSNLIRKYATHRLSCSRIAGSSLFGHDWNPDGKSMGIVPNALDLNPFMHIRSTTRESLRRAWFNSNNIEGPVVLHIGRFVKEKNHRFILDVFQSLLDSVPTAILILAGEGPELQNMKAEAEQRGLLQKVQFLGIVDQIPELIAAADVFLFPSITEGLGMAVIEAQAGGLPCLVSDAIPEEADIGIDRLFRLSLNDSKELWVQQIIDLLQFTRPPVQFIEAALVARKYVASSLYPLMKEIYTYGSAEIHS
ncbi:MAG: glycosyltransferase [Candidatus Cohnella colombiensis]|uniref:Glycosyltransferase n=1 Tax=Candidatus Cohnella colombiensis TaxID=3121368 RepID=A0AA95EUG0_9BACL|nr:MAG: glycosyltransferase [Cohnella sp.]